MPVSCHFRGCKAPLSRIVSGAISSELPSPSPFYLFTFTLAFIMTGFRRSIVFFFKKAVERDSFCRLRRQSLLLTCYVTCATFRCSYKTTRHHMIASIRRRINVSQQFDFSTEFLLANKCKLLYVGSSLLHCRAVLCPLLLARYIRKISETV